METAVRYHVTSFSLTPYTKRLPRDATPSCSLRQRNPLAFGASLSIFAPVGSWHRILHSQCNFRITGLAFYIDTQGVVADKDEATTAQPAADEHLKVLTTWASPFGMRVLVALHEKELRFEYQEEILRSFSPEAILSNPIHEKVPVFIHNGRALAESRIILHYIDEQWPASNPHKKGSLLPTSPWDRAQARFWADFIDTKMCDVAHDILVKNGEQQQRAIEETIQNLFLLDKSALGGIPFTTGAKHAMFNGDHLGLLDICLVGFLQWFRVFEVISNFKLPGRDKCPRLNAWIDAVSQEPSVKKVIPDLDRLVDRARASRCRRGSEDWNKTYLL